MSKRRRWLDADRDLSRLEDGVLLNQREAGRGCQPPLVGDVGFWVSLLMILISAAAVVLYAPFSI